MSQNDPEYPREVQSWVNELDVLLTFMDYPGSIRSVIYTTNAIERTIKEIRKRLKPMTSLNSLEAAEKVVYLTIKDFNKKWAERKLLGFAEAQEVLSECLKNVTINQILQINKIRVSPFPHKRLNFQSPVWKKQALSILNPFQRCPIYLTLHKILDGTELPKKFMKKKYLS